MTTTLRQVLDHFERQSGALSLPQMARELGIERATLQNMIDYWVRKGKLREVSVPTCTTCGSAPGCPFVVALPRRYELTAAQADEPASCPTATCGCSTRSKPA